MTFKQEIERLVNSYWEWNKQNTLLTEISKSSWLEITTPYLDRHNDCLQIYVKMEDGGLILTDDGYIINDLMHSGCNLNTPKRQEFLKTTLAGFGIQEENHVLVVRATRENFAIKQHNLIQAMLAVNDLFYLAQGYTQNIFYEDVTNWLDLQEIRYTPKIRFQGKSGFDNSFDLVIPKSKTQPERVIQTINHPQKDSISELIFRWQDTKATRPVEAKLYAILNDANELVSPNVVEALKNYESGVILWSQREKMKTDLAA